MLHKRVFWLLLVVGCFLTVISVVGLGQEEGVKALSIIVDEIRPPEGAGFAVELSVDKGCGASYEIGEYVTISVKSGKAGYLTIYDFTPDGRVIPLFPNYVHLNNYIEAGRVYQIPAPGDPFKFKVGPPLGMDILKAIVTTKPGIAPAGKPDKTSPFAEMSRDPRGFAKQLNIVVEPQQDWGAATCVYYIGVTYGSVTINSVPQGAEVYWDGAYYWQTPVTIYGQTAGPHTLLLKKEGYQDSTQQVVVLAGQDTPITVALQPIGMGWQARPKVQTVTGGVTTVWATAFDSDGTALISGWYWLRDPAFQASFGWRLPIDVGLPTASEAWFNLSPLVTSGVNGGQGFETTIQLSIIVKDAYGNVVTQTSHQVHLTNPFRPKSPIDSRGEGYQTYGLLPLSTQWPTSLPVGGTLEIRATRLPTSYDGIYQPHVAFNPDALVLRYR